MKSSEILLLAGAAVAGWYFLVYKPAQQPLLSPLQSGSLDNNATPATSGMQSVNPGGVPMLDNSTAVSIPVPGANQVTQAGQNPNATLAQQQTIFAWAVSMTAKDQATFFAKWGSMSASDVAGLMDLIVNEWQGGQPVTPARTAFWNNWRQTYGIDIG